MAKQIVGVYETRDEAIANIRNLKNNGYDTRELSIVADEDEKADHIQTETGVSPEAWAANVAQATDESNDKENGSILDNITSALKGEARDYDINTPKYSDRFMEMGVPETEAREYDAYLADGNVIVLAEATNNADDDITTGESDEEKALRLHEERLDVSKSEITKGEVEIHKDVVEEEKTINVPVSKEEVYVKKRNVEEDQLSENTAEIGDDEEIHIPVREEKVEVTKKPVTTDEIVVGKRNVEETEQVRENVKREEAHIEEDGVEIKNENDQNNW